MSVLIEFTKDTAKRKIGDRLRVDNMSARSFCDGKNKVARRIEEAAEASAADVEPEAPASGASDL